MSLSNYEISQDYLDGSYNNIWNAPDGPSRLARWSQESIRVRADNNNIVRHHYGDNERNIIDYISSDEQTKPCMIFIHGGYWQTNSPDTFTLFSKGVQEHHWSTAIIGYPLAPEASLSTILHDVNTAVTKLVSIRKERGHNGKLIVVGTSAGGCLASLLLERDEIDSGVAISGVFELAPLKDTYLNEKLNLSDAEIKHLSPFRRPSTKKPFHIVYGHNELATVIANSVAYHAKRMRDGAAGELVEISDTDHFSILEGLTSGSSQLTKLICKLDKS